MAILIKPCDVCIYRLSDTYFAEDLSSFGVRKADVIDKSRPPLSSRVIFVIVDHPTLAFQKTYHYKGLSALRRPILYCFYFIY